ncbi:MAG: Peptide deformylase [Berkelbacteria bacterium GW2011_GWA1_36_9]|uniref:Multifunctional fusion protein n=1 Tax=Berkelbacteria bacterium GW2011_GWA1_36_9 TaxID=1618331 RepID=A0A0G0HZR4_9BACT|nr:MAG: Peptide deformylase [Berkelbacteria bacterium GW2011_GWA1_36_9]
MKEQLITLKTIPNSILSEATLPVISFENDLLKQIKLMRRFLKTNDGAGLAANQIGIKNNVIVIEFEEKENSPKSESIPFQAFINPQIVECSKEQESSEEGCLSIPKIELPVTRAKKIKIRFQDSQGKKKKLAASGILARILQHEIDHLNGIIFTERIKEKFLLDNPEFKNLKIVFFGSGKFGATILEGLILIGLKPTIITEKGKPAGRGKELKLTPVAEMAQRFGRKYTEVDKNSLMSLQMLVEQSFDLIICADFGKIIPENVLKMAKITAINIHPSLLPKYRGATPIQTTILNGDKITGASIIKMNNKIDQGEVLAQIETKILENDNSLTLSDRLSTLALQLLFDTLPYLAKNKLQALEQDESKASLTQKFQKSDGEINWQESPEVIDRKIRAFYPWPGSYTILPDGKRLLIHHSHFGSGSMVLDMVRLEGGKAVKWQDFLRGYRGGKPEWFDKVK